MVFEISTDNICRINNNKCSKDNCCSLDNKCGFGLNYCNTNDEYNGDNSLNKYDTYINNEKQYIYDNNTNLSLSKNNRCGIDLKNKLQYYCPKNKYCNDNSFCDNKNINVLKLKINNKDIETKKYDGINTYRDIPIKEEQNIISTDNKCGLQNNYKICSNNQCCSSSGDCGNSKEHCYISYKEYKENEINLDNINVINKKYFSSPEAIENYDKNLNNKLEILYDNDEINISSNGLCGFNKDVEQVYKCPPEQCCSKNGICGYGFDFCEENNNNNSIKLNGLNAIKNYNKNKSSDKNLCIDKKCPDNLCCSKTGVCGSGKEFCGVINNDKEKNGINALENYKNDLFNKLNNDNLYISDKSNNFCGKDIITEKIYKCNTNECCYNNKCGSGYDFCEFADDNNYNGDNALENYNKNRISTDGTCYNKICIDGECCGDNKKCGNGDKYCTDLNNKFNGKNALQYMYDNNNLTTDLSLNICGIKNNKLYKCNPGFCCLKNGNCSLDCSQSLDSNFDNDKIKKITFYVNKNSNVLKLKINELKDLNSKSLNIKVKNTDYINYAIKDNKIFINTEIFELINNLINYEYNKNKLNGNNAVNNYFNKKKLDTYNKGKFISNNNCYIDHKNNINYKCPTNKYCNYNNNTCYSCNNVNNKTIDNIKLHKLDGNKSYNYLLFYLIFFIVFIFIIIYFVKKNKK